MTDAHEWHRWFAWHPVRVLGGKLRWMTRIWRRKVAGRWEYMADLTDEEQW